MTGSYVVDQFHDEDGLANASTTEEADFAAFGIGADKVNDLDPCFKDFCTRSLVFKFRYRAVDWPVVGSFYLLIYFINCLAQDIENPAQNTFSDRYLDRAACIFCFHAAHQTVCGAHGYTADDIVAQVLHDFCYQINRLIACAAGDMDGVIYSRQVFFARKADVYDRANDLNYFPNCIAHEEALLLI